MSEPSNFLPVRPGRPARKPRSHAELSPAEERELAAAKQGKREWVGPGLCAYMLGISKEALKKRRQRRDGLLPEHKEARSNREGAKYRWSSVARCAGAERFQSEVLAERLEDVAALLRRHGIAALPSDLPWAADAQGRLVGLSALHPGLVAQPLSFEEALSRPWVSEGIRAPYHRLASDLLNDAAARVRKAGD